MKNLIIIIILCSVAILIGCFKKIDRQMTVGKYIANHQKGLDILELNQDGSYKYQYRTLGGKEIKNSNKWEFKYLDGKPTITFSSFIFGLPGYGSDSRGFWIVEVKRSVGGSLKLIIDPDLNYYYTKQKT